MANPHFLFLGLGVRELWIYEGGQLTLSLFGKEWRRCDRAGEKNVMLS
ncbi:MULTISPECIES: hypothetical protein [Spirulina sp. CCY15215]|nr:hypothetical protein [Spirulina major]